MEGRPCVLSKDMINFSTHAIKYRQEVVGNQKKIYEGKYKNDKPIRHFFDTIIGNEAANGKTLIKQKISLKQETMVLYITKKNFSK